MPEINIERTTPAIDIDTATRNYHLPIASSTTLGGIKVGNNLTIETDGTLNAESTEYNLPVATSSTLGGVKVGSSLSISNSVLSVTVDSSLNPNSSNPVKNSVVDAAISTVSSGLQDLSGTVGIISSNYTTLSNTVSAHTTSISNLNSTVTSQGNDIQTNTDDIATMGTSISNNTYSIGELDTRLTNAEGSIIDISDDLSPLIDNDITTLQVTDILPASTWTTGNINVIKRGNVGYVYIDLEGSLTISADSREVLYTFSDIIPLVKSNSTLLTNDGAVVGEFDDYDYRLSLVNLDPNQAVHITKVKGCIPIVFA